MYKDHTKSQNSLHTIRPCCVSDQIYSLILFLDCPCNISAVCLDLCWLIEAVKMQ